MTILVARALRTFLRRVALSQCIIAGAVLFTSACGSQAAVITDIDIVTPSPAVAAPATDLSQLSERWKRWFRKQSCPRIPIGSTQEPVKCGPDCPIVVSRQTFENKSNGRVEILQMTLTKRRDVPAEMWERHVEHSPAADICPKVQESNDYEPTDTDEGDLGVCEVGERKR